MIDANEIWHEAEEQRRYLFFGDSDINWYALDLKEGMFHELDKPSGSVMETFSDFNEMLASALEYTLD
ncbi:YrhA family protein [Mesobacillus foraminis]|uniref:YrhA family protein n=1 Tax=Mesobacillus foraminis TaxID=279826 RepID=UPI001C5809F7